MLYHSLMSSYFLCVQVFIPKACLCGAVRANTSTEACILDQRLQFLHDERKLMNANHPS